MDECLHQTIIASIREQDQSECTENSMYVHDSGSESDDSCESFASKHLDEMKVLNFDDNMQFNDKDSGDFNILDDIEGHLEYIGN
eukprot:6010400-Ditylum_brightwellii.AAC.1